MTYDGPAHCLVRALEKKVFVALLIVYLDSALILFLLETLPLAHVFPACGAALKSYGLAGGQWGWDFEGNFRTLVFLLLSALFPSVRSVFLLCCRLPAMMSDFTTDPEAPGPTDYGRKHQNYEQQEPFSLYGLTSCHSNRELTQAIVFFNNHVVLVGKNGVCELTLVHRSFLF